MASRVSQRAQENVAAPAPHFQPLLPADLLFPDVRPGVDDEQLRLQLERERSYDAQLELAADRDWHTDLFDRTPIPLFVLDGQGMIEERNEASRALYPRPPRRPGLRYPFVVTIAERFRRQWLDCLVVCPRRRGHRFTIAVEVLDSQQHAVKARLEVVVLSAAPNRFCLVAVLPADGGGFVSTSEQVNLAAVTALDHRVADRLKQLQDANLRLEQADQRKNEFLAVLGHELRNPLASLTNGLSILTMSEEIRAGFEPVVNLMQRQVANMTRLLNDLSDVSRLTFGKLVLNRQHCDLRDSVRAAVEACRPVLRLKKHELKLSIVDHDCPVYCDTMRVGQILINLLQNSCKYTDSGGIISIDVRRNADVLEVEVADNGMGMNPETLAAAFELFKQSDRSQSHSEGGLGIGLAMVRALAELQNGGVTAYSDGPGRGTRVVVWFPVAQAETEPEKPAAAIADSIAPLKIVIVEDNADAANALALLLRGWGHEVRVAYDGAAGLELLLEMRPELALIDLHLPLLDGYTIASRAREELGQQMRLIALSGYNGENDNGRAERAGFDGRLSKPLFAEQLRQLVQQAAV